MNNPDHSTSCPPPPSARVPEQRTAGVSVGQWKRAPRHAVALSPAGTPLLCGRGLGRAQHPKGEHLQSGRQHRSVGMGRAHAHSDQEIYFGFLIAG